jgi:predicted dehydrogenase
MGKRRIRNCQAIGVKHIYGFDSNPTRCAEAVEKYGIYILSGLNKLPEQQFDVFIISVPPDKHHIFMQMAVEFRTPTFVEASVVDDFLKEISTEAGKKKVFIAPSCTLFFHPAIKYIQSVLKTSLLGNISNVLYHSGQFLPDWHSYEEVKDYYVSKKSTGGAREIVPFELTWMTMLWGYPNRVKGFYKKTIDIRGAEEIDDTYNALLEYDNFIVNLSVDVVSRVSTRRLLINGSEGQLRWDWDESAIRIYSANKGNWETVAYDVLPSEAGYDKNITEQMYIAEITAFFNSILNYAEYPNSLMKDLKVLEILYAIEKSSDEFVSA